jgi:PAS domain S-box-containing protein
MGFIAWYSRRNRGAVAGAGTYMWIALLAGLAAVLQGISMAGPTEAWALVWFNVRFACFAVIPPLWLVFILRFTGKQGLLSKPRIALLFVIPAITQIMLWTNDWHGLWAARDVAFNRVGPFFVPLTSARAPGPGYAAHIVYANAVMLAGLVVLFVASIQMRGRSRGQALILGAGTLVMVFGALFSSFSLAPGMTLNIVPQSFALGSLIIAWGLYRHRFLAAMPVVDHGKPVPLALIVMYVTASLGIMTAAFMYYRHYEQRYRARAEQELDIIARLKVDDLVRWRAERTGDGAMLSGNATFRALARRYWSGPGDEAVRGQIFSWLLNIRDSRRYDSVMLLDARGAVRLTTDAAGHLAHLPARRFLDEARGAGAPVLSDFHREEAGLPIHLSVIVPLHDGPGRGADLGFVVMIIDPEQWLYPMISRWPGPERTAETLLVRRDGDSVLYLNELRHKKNSALNLRFSLDKKRLPAAMAVLGHEGVVDGIDYRGVPVVAALRSVPGSPWRLVARMDQSEVYAPVRERFWIMVGVLGVLLAGTGAGAGLLWRRQGERHVRERLEAAEALREQEDRYRLLADHMTDTVWLMDMDLRTTFISPSVVRVRGFTLEELRDMPLERHLTPASLKAATETFVEEMARLNADPSYAFHRTLELEFYRKDGSSFWSENTFTVIRDERGRPASILGEGRDITERKRAEEAMRASEARYRRLFETAKDGIIILDAETGMIADVNPFMIEMLGFSYEQFQGKTIWDIGFFGDIVPNRDKFLELQEKEFVRYEDLPLETADGRKMDVEFVSNVYEVDSKKVIQCNIRDITARVRMQKALDWVSAHQKALLAAIPDIVMEVDMNKVCTWANGPGIEFFGEDVVGKEAAYYFEGEQDTYQKVRPIFNGDESVIYLESWQRRRDGEKRLLAWWCNALKDGNGRVTGALSSARDITERRRAEEALRLKNMVFDASLAATSIADLNGTITQANDAFLRVWGYSEREDVIGKPISFFFLDENEAALIVGALNDTGAWEGLFTARRKDGSTFIAQSQATAVRDETGALIAYQSAVLDVTDRQRAEAALVELNETLERRVRERTADLEEANREIASFAYSVSHDLRAPLRAIDGFSKALLEDCADRLDGRGRDYLERIRKGSQRMGRLIDDILRLSRAGRQELAREEVDLGAMAGSVLRDLARLEPGRTVETVVREGVGAVGDPALLRVVLENLLGNAWKFTSKRAGARIEFGATDIDGKRAFFVRDNGAGFDMKYADRLFTPFQRLHSTHEFEGTGIGLALVKRVVGRHGGRVWAEGAPGSGATFYFTLE